MKILSVVGARPQFIKAKPIVDELKRKKVKHILIHTGQHYDYEMSKIFFDELNIPEPNYNLEVGSDLHGKQTARILERIEYVLLKEKPDFVIVYGDTNSTLGSALAAVKLNIPVAHIEAGLRSYDRKMPEEINRVLTDHLSELLFCPTKTAVKNLHKEGIRKGIYLVGDVMYDVFLKSQKLLDKRRILSKLNLKPKEYLLLTVHRQENTDNHKNLKSILKALATVKEKIVFPVHPRTQKTLQQNNIAIERDSNFLFIKPVSYLDMLVLEKNAKKILTDSGGVQKEAFFFRIPCVTLREETEWIETVETNINILAGTNRESIIHALRKTSKVETSQTAWNIFGNGKASETIVRLVIDTCGIIK